MGYQKVFQSSLVASFAVLLGILCFVSGFGEASLSNNVQRGAYQQVSPIVQVSPTVQVQVTPVVTQQCQKLCVTATQTQIQSCIYTSTQVPYISQCVTVSPTTCYKYVTRYKQVCCEQEYEQQQQYQQQECTQYCQLSYQQSVSYPCQTQISYPCQEYRLMQLQQCCQIPKVKCVQYTQACIQQQIQEQQVQQQQQQEEQQVQQEVQQVQQVEQQQELQYY
ncbi:hypothetical protein GAYE_SCF06G2811 [Galdieria yellowstonensis]|uniref:Uncharacterized protein n=1 Tax=Galdieria yellowstonensis TaxID=3028027 RepID=A0AAV9IC33_9RHOD|nr:hypothetical protein GAYE_SCF06G2811 [Galdieria yellowstonensis]